MTWTKKTLQNFPPSVTLEIWRELRRPNFHASEIARHVSTRFIALSLSSCAISQVAYCVCVQLGKNADVRGYLFHSLFSRSRAHFPTTSSSEHLLSNKLVYRRSILTARTKAGIIIDYLELQVRRKK
jgi:hypothetical protein